MNSFDIPYLGDRVDFYEARLLSLFQQHQPTRSDFSVVTHEKGKAGGAYKLTRVWSANADTLDRKAKEMAGVIVAERKRYASSAIDHFAVEF